MANLCVIYTESGFYNELTPTWVVVDCRRLSAADWRKTLYIPIDAPFERIEVPETDDTLSVAVPSCAYTRRSDKPSHIGVHLPTVSAFAQCQFQRQDDWTFDCAQVDRLVLRIIDAEDTLQMEIRERMIIHV